MLNNEVIVELEHKLEFELKVLEAEEWEVDHILHLYGQRLGALDIMGKPIDESTQKEFIDAYVNGEQWVTSISYELYAKKLIQETLAYFKQNKIPITVAINRMASLSKL